MSRRNDDAFARLFPSPNARKAADDAIDRLTPQDPMHVYTDTWVAAYLAAGGKATMRLA